MRILLGGVPFGYGNVGDEAILCCVIDIFRRNFPDAELTVCTASPEESAARYNVAALPAFGFDPRYNMRHFRRAAKKFDIFVWAGGTGLSDYPQIGASLLENAQQLKLKTVIWQVGMNRELNPEYFQLHGRMLKIADLFGITRYLEYHMEQRIRERLQVCVSQCSLTVLRDQPSLIELHHSGEFPAAFYGADSVLLLTNDPAVTLPADKFNRRSIGICVAEKLNRLKFDQAVKFLQRLQTEQHARLVFIPMTDNDRCLMEPLAEALKENDNYFSHYTDPAQVQSIIKGCSLLLSGRLQLTIMALNESIPGIGIANSSKIANCLSMFGLPVFKNQSTINFDDLYSECQRWLSDSDFARRAQDVRKRMLKRIDQSEKYLQDLA